MRLSILIGAILMLAFPARSEELSLEAPALGSLALAHGARAGKLIGAEIYARDADLGEIDDLIIDLQSGSVNAVIIAINGFLDHRLIAVPPDAIKVGADNHLTIDATIGGCSFRNPDVCR